MEYRKKPIVIEAIQFDGTLESYDEITNCFGIRSNFVLDKFKIATLEGSMWANKNDWIIKGVKNEIYLCSNDVFEMTYEKCDTNVIKLPKMYSDEAAKELLAWVDGLTLEELSNLKQKYNDGK